WAARLLPVGLPRNGARGEIRTHTSGRLGPVTPAVGLPAHGLSGWIRTTTSAVKGRACCVDTTERRLERPTSNALVPRPWRGRVFFPHPGRSSAYIGRVLKDPRHHGRLATAPGFEPGPTSFGGSDAPVTPRCRRSLRNHRLDRH